MRSAAPSAVGWFESIGVRSTRIAGHGHFPAERAPGSGRFLSWSTQRSGAIYNERSGAAATQPERRTNSSSFDGIAFRHGHVLRFIDDAGARVTDLSERSGVTKQAIGDLVTELERMGYVERVPDQEDRRAKNVRLTPRGVQAQTAGRRILDEIDAEWRGQLGEEPLTALRRVLEAIVRLA